jgi:hypothetical protein
VHSDHLLSSFNRFGKLCELYCVHVRRLNGGVLLLALLPSCLSCVQVIAPHLSARLESLSGQELPQLVRGAAEQVLRTSQLEGQLLEQLFGTAVTAQRPPQAYGVQTQGELM